MSNERIPPKRRSKLRDGAPKADTRSKGPQSDRLQAEVPVVLAQAQAEAARREAEQVRRVAEVTRETSEHDRKTAEVVREGPRRAPTSGRDSARRRRRGAACGRGRAPRRVDSVNATAESLKTTLEQMSVVEEMRRMLREIRDTKKLDPN